MKEKSFAFPFVVLVALALLISACGTPATAVPATAPAPPSADSQVGGGVPGQPTQAAANPNPAAGDLQGTLPDSKEAPIQEAPSQEAQAAAAAVESQIPAVPAPGEYPTSPEGVVQAFLASYVAQPKEMKSYLSQSQADSLPSGGIKALLGFQGDLEGFVIDAAAVSPQPPAAVVSAAVKVGGAEIRRSFTLSKENDAWKIESIESQVQ